MGLQENGHVKVCPASGKYRRIFKVSELEKTKKVIETLEGSHTLSTNI